MVQYRAINMRYQRKDVGMYFVGNCVPEEKIISLTAGDIGNLFFWNHVANKNKWNLNNILLMNWI